MTVVEIPAPQMDLAEAYKVLLQEYHTALGLWSIDRHPKVMPRQWIVENAFQKDVDPRVERALEAVRLAVDRTALKADCETCDGSGCVEVWPDALMFAPCDECRPSDLKLWNEGYRAAQAAPRDTRCPGCGEQNCCGGCAHG